MGHLAEKLNTIYITNPLIIFYKIAFTFPNLMTLDISDKLEFVIEESRGFFYQFCSHQLIKKGKDRRFNKRKKINISRYTWTSRENFIEISALKPFVVLYENDSRYH